MEHVLAAGEIHEDRVRDAILVLFPDAELDSDTDGQLVINTNVMWSGKNGDFLLGNLNVGGTVSICSRCHTPVETRVEVVCLDGEERNDCPESEDGLPHEPTKLIARFVPQTWLGDQALDVDPHGPDQWDVTEAFFALDDESYRATLLEELSEFVDGETIDVNDELRSDPHAPEWVRHWDGPFTLHITKAEPE